MLNDVKTIMGRKSYYTYKIQSKDNEIIFKFELMRHSEENKIKDIQDIDKSLGLLFKNKSVELIQKNILESRREFKKEVMCHVNSSNVFLSNIDFI